MPSSPVRTTESSRKDVPINVLWKDTGKNGVDDAKLLTLFSVFFLLFLSESRIIAENAEVVRIADYAEKATLTSTSSFLRDGDTVRKTISSFRVFCVLRAFRDSDGKKKPLTSASSAFSVPSAIQPISLPSVAGEVSQKKHPIKNTSPVSISAPLPLQARFPRRNTLSKTPRRFTIICNFCFCVIYLLKKDRGFFEKKWVIFG